MRHLPRAFGTAAVLIFGLLFLPSTARATITWSAAQCVTSEGCVQTINFNNQPVGIVQVGDTNPAPYYNVYFTSVETPTLSGNGSTLGAASGPSTGFLTMDIVPEAGWAWSAFEFQADSVNSTLATGVGLTLTAWDASNVAFSQVFTFPYEGNSGTNQHYHADATAGEVITRILISYDPGTSGNLIHDLHNMDVNSVEIGPHPVPEPATLTLLGLGLIAVGYRRRRKA